MQTRLRFPASPAVVAAVATVAIVVVACSSTVGPSPLLERDQLPPSEATRHRVFVAEGDQAWAERADRARLERSIERWTAAVAVKSDDHATLGKLARAEYLLADGWLAFERDRAAHLAALRRGMEHAERGMRALSSEFESRRMSGATVEQASPVLAGADAVPLLYWYAANLSRWANARGFAAVLEHKDEALSLVRRVAALDADYYHGAPDRYLGAFFAVAPAFAGGDLQRSLAHFRRSLAIAPEFLMTHVLIAELYAPRAHDRALFDESLATVLAGESVGPDDIAAENAVARRKAAALAGRADELF